MPPDVARMGDINIYSDHDDKYAQQLKIVKVIRHPKHRFGIRYYDIALMKLETYIRKSHFVHPICLWLNDEIPFPRLLAAGWGITGIGEDQSKVLLQVALSPVNNTECAKHHKGGGIALRNGIEDHQMCAVDPKMDLCPSKQQVVFCKNNNVVCCPEIAANLQTTAIEKEFNECEERYAHLRSNQQNDTSHIVEIGWHEAEQKTYGCYGYLISTRGVVSSASCLLEQAELPNIVRLGGLGISNNPETIRIEKVEIHPRYNKTTQQNNIAIVKLASTVKPSEQAFPGCLWQNFTHSPVLQQVYDFSK
uniref:Peptidase S1 domain-containing protein n=1 Tax=Anopheles maculatus TaxID=74869 RepID=A0A182SJG9_9DIPT